MPLAIGLRRVKSVLAFAALCLFTAACSGKPTPITDQFRSTYRLSTVEVKITAPDLIPERYVEDVEAYLETDGADQEGFATSDWAEREMDLDISERLFGFLVQEQINKTIPTAYTGDSEATLTVEIPSADFPNAFKTIMIGGVLSARYRFTLIDNETNALLARSSDALYTDASNKTGTLAGGVLGAVARSGQDNRRIKDIYNITLSLGTDLEKILIGPEMPVGVGSKVVAYPDNIRSTPEPSDVGYKWTFE